MSQQMTCLPENIVAHMRAHCPARTDEMLQARFGISYNTWRRIDAGLPVRMALAARIITRIDQERGSPLAK
jgi:hypothetical protein